jgi:5-methylthioribose kinase
VQAVRANPALKMAIAEMKRTYVTHAEALIHADLHTGSIMLNTEDTRVIDPEFAFFGPMAYDVGAVLQNLVLNYLSHYAHTPDPTERAAYQDYLLDMVRDIWNEFARKFDAVWAANNRGELVPQSYWAFPGGERPSQNRRAPFTGCYRNGRHGGVKFLRRSGHRRVWDFTSIRIWARGR